MSRADKHIIAYCEPANVVEFKHPFIETFFRGERGLRAIEAMPDAPDNNEESRQEHKQQQRQDKAS